MKEEEEVASNNYNVEEGGVVDDPLFWKLPTPVFHHILSFLPPNYDTKEVIKLGLVSKSWLERCFSYPVLDFSVPSQPRMSYACDALPWIRHLCLPPRRKIKRRKTKWFMEFVEKIMSRVHDDAGIQRFKLEAHWHVQRIEEFASTVDRWVDIAIKNKVQDFYLSFDVHHEKDEKYVIPGRLLSLGSLKSLSLGHQVSLPPSCCVDLYALRTLEILFAKIDNQDLGRLLRGCPLVENLTLKVNHDKLIVIVISGLKHVKMIHFCHVHLGSELRLKVKVEAPSLQTLCLSYIKWYSNLEFECCNLKCLKLVCNYIYHTSAEEWFSGFLSRFPLLESLELSESVPLDIVRIRHPMLKKVEFAYPSGLKHVYIKYKLKILCFRFRAILGFYLPTIHVQHPPSYFQLHIEKDLNMLLCSNFFIGMSEMLMSIPSSSHTSLSICIRQIKVYKDGRMEFDSLQLLEPIRKALRRGGPFRECEIDELNLAILECSLTYPTILNSLLTFFHPTAINLEIVSDSKLESPDFTKFVCENLAGRAQGKYKCRCYRRITCWKHKLKEVKIEGIKGGLDDECGPLDWCNLFQLLPTLRVGSKIMFRLEWV